LNDDQLKKIKSICKKYNGFNGVYTYFDFEFFSFLLDKRNCNLNEISLSEKIKTDLTKVISISREINIKAFLSDFHNIVYFYFEEE